MTAEATAEARRQYEQTRAQNPVRQEAQRQYTQKKIQSRKADGLCVGCASPPVPGQTRCPTCAHEHQQSRRRSETAARQEINQASGQSSFL